MPTYTFEKENGEQYLVTMPWEKLEQYLLDNPTVHQVYKLNIVDPVSIGVKKPPADFQKNILGRVKEIPGADKNVVEKRWAIPKEI